MTGLVYWDFEDGVDGQPFTDVAGGDAYGSGGSVDTISGILMRGWNEYAGPAFSSVTPPGSGLSAYCNGDQDGYTTDTSLNTWSPQTWTIELSFKIQAFNGANYTLIGRDGSSSGTSSSDFYLQLLGWDSNRLRLNYYSVGGTRWTLDSSLFALAGQWYRLAVVSDGQTIDMYVDQSDGNGYQNVGTFDISAQSVADNAIASSGDNWTFGRGWYNSSFVDHINGYLDNVRFSESVLTPEEFLDAPAPVFTSDPIINLDAVELSSYAGQSLANYARDLNGMNTVTFSKDTGPDWLTVASDGTLSGIPTDSTSGTNTFTVRVTDAGGEYDTATMTIDVANVYSGVLGVEDLLGLAAQWLMTDCVDTPACDGADLSGDAGVDMEDVRLMAHNWLIDEAMQLSLQFNETSGDTANDKSIYLRSGLLVNGPVWSTGTIGGAIDFDGTDDYVDVTGYPGILGNTSRTCCAWIKTAVGGDILGWGSNESAGAKWRFQVTATGLLSIQLQGGKLNSDTGGLLDDAWHHVAVVVPETASPATVGDMLLYIDGSPVSTTATTPGTVINTSGDGQVKIGVFEYNGAGLYYFDGLIDDVRVYNTALTESEINEIANP